MKFLKEYLVDGDTLMLWSRVAALLNANMGCCLTMHWLYFLGRAFATTIFVS
jgi:hypothetical protein